MATRILLLVLPFHGISRNALSAECLLSDERSLPDLWDLNQTDVQQQALLLVHISTQCPQSIATYSLTSENNEDLTWSDIRETPCEAVSEMKTAAFEASVDSRAEESMVLRTVSPLMLVWLLILGTIVVASLLLIKDARRRRLLEEEQQHREKVRSQRAACLEQLKRSDVHSSDAFGAREKGLLLKIMATLEEREDDQAFECAICYETCLVLAPAHSHGSTCTDCQRRSADLAVESGRFPECPICRERLSLRDLASIGASERTQNYVQEKVRMEAHAALLDVVQSSWEAFGEAEGRELSQLLTAFSRAAGAGKTSTRFCAPSQERVLCE
mmetsp:Transcript_10815/g.20229  ORF Transcript_10815/g.20229 Transcript_10815/m.20229 type:complete len:329 (+) Transcript_10815:22-1008(+)